MNRNLLLAALVATSGLTAFFSAVPDGIRRAEGCSGASSVACGAPGWSKAAWAVDPSGVPTDGAVLVELTAAYTCGGPSGAGGAAGGASVTLSVRGPDGQPVAGTPGTVAGPVSKSQPAPGPSTGTQTATWRPTTALLPSTTYTLLVEGLVGATKTVELTFTTGAGAFAAPKPVLSAPSLSVDAAHVTGPSICCMQPPSAPSYCSGTATCAGQTIQPRPVLSGKADVEEPVPAAKVFLKAVLQVSMDDGPFVEGPVDLTGTKKNVCARVEATNVLTKQTAVSDPWCAPVAGLDLTPSPNCKAMLDTLTKCGANPSGTGGSGGLAPGYQLSPGKADAIALYQSVCGTAGNGGAGGSTAGAGGSTAGAGGSTAGAGGSTAGAGGSTAGAGGATAGAGGSTAGAGGSTAGAGGSTAGMGGSAAGSAGSTSPAPGVEANEGDDGGGCSVPAGPRPVGAGGALGVLLGLAALLRARSRQR